MSFDPALKANLHNKMWPTGLRILVCRTYSLGFEPSEEQLKANFSALNRIKILAKIEWDWHARTYLTNALFAICCFKLLWIDLSNQHKHFEAETLLSLLFQLVEYLYDDTGNYAHFLMEMGDLLFPELARSEHSVSFARASLATEEKTAILAFKHVIRQVPYLLNHILLGRTSFQDMIKRVAFPMLSLSILAVLWCWKICL